MKSMRVRVCTDRNRNSGHRPCGIAARMSLAIEEVPERVTSECILFDPSGLVSRYL